MYQHKPGQAQIQIGGALDPNREAKELEAVVNPHNPDRIQNESDLRQVLANAQKNDDTGIARELIKLRHQVPFVPIKQFPIVSKSVVFNSNPSGLITPLDMTFPDLAKTVKFTSSQGADFFVSINGNAENIAYAVNNGLVTSRNGSYNEPNAINSILNPTDEYYIGFIKSCSILGTVAGQVVNAQFYILGNNG